MKRFLADGMSLPGHGALVGTPGPPPEPEPVETAEEKIARTAKTSRKRTSRSKASKEVEATPSPETPSETQSAAEGTDDDPLAAAFRAAMGEDSPENGTE